MQGCLQTVPLAAFWKLASTVAREDKAVRAICMALWLVVWNIFYFPIYWEESSTLTNMFIYFSEGFKPPTILSLMRFSQISTVLA